MGVAGMGAGVAGSKGRVLATRAAQAALVIGGGVASTMATISLGQASDESKGRLWVSPNHGLGVRGLPADAWEDSGWFELEDVRQSQDGTTIDGTWRGHAVTISDWPAAERIGTRLSLEPREHWGVVTYGALASTPEADSAYSSRSATLAVPSATLGIGIAALGGAAMLVHRRGAHATAAELSTAAVCLLGGSTVGPLVMSVAMLGPGVSDAARQIGRSRPTPFTGMG